MVWEGNYEPDHDPQVMLLKFHQAEAERAKQRTSIPDYSDKPLPEQVELLTKEMWKWLLGEKYYTESDCRSGSSMYKTDTDWGARVIQRNLNKIQQIATIIHALQDIQRGMVEQ